MSTNTRHSSVEALKERYQKSRQLAIENNKNNNSLAVTTVYEEEEEEEEDDENEKESEDSDDDDDNDSFYSSKSSIPDEDINFDLVYALHTFVATLDGQASVVKGDAMTLLDDTNSYWWLVKALKTSEVGYIPAENIEVKYSKLAFYKLKQKLFK
jgi:ABC-type Zn2+ transport system substrate-binding protein/surface adhesin